MSVIDPQALTTSLQRLAGRGTADELLPTLRAVVDACVDLFGVSGAGIMLADEQNMTRYVAASDGPGRILEIVESETGQGPCTQAFVTNQIVPSSDVTTDSRWPRLATLIRPHGVRAVLGVPIALGGAPVGTLDVYLTEPHEWTSGEHAALSRYGDVVEAALAASLSAHRAGELAEQLQYALDYRVVIERGIGYLMARDHLDEVSAFNQLRRAARNSQRKVGDVAEHLLATGDLPGGQGNR
ncbi:hypothetical protein GCM10011575_42990 [Microlunatus endophyticus]|uniref:ANTAR domain-containing protein n=1 Tax=Microlunatus endophyticus TaxID=1716077 RepID=A0A917SG13_9ACTN|nr:GAF and ANTAR domain-containing protein [Microlunatus endophyticus]GGL80151.1 hypothetical protein GCM10011575_42990 [Microlunatus endophyticus]